VAFGTPLAWRMHSTLYEADRHEALREVSWDSGRVDAAIDEIVAGTLAAQREDGHWPLHPDDSPAAPAWDGSLYFGTAGVVWALGQLGTSLPNARTLLQEAAQSVQERGASLGLGDDYRRGLLLGPVGVHVVGCTLTPDPAVADALYRNVCANAMNPVLDFMWGAPGTMLAAYSLFTRTGEVRWAEAFRSSAAQLFADLERSPSVGAAVWNQHLYGVRAAHIGAGHGFAGNVAPVLVGRELLAPTEFERWREAAMTTAQATAIVAGEYANWPQSIDGHRPGRTARLVQWCHGAPGVVIALGTLCDGSERSFDALLLGGGELVWRAGPLRKGAGLCHGTAGNGYALLRLFAQTQDERWLERARAFAMHALGQTVAARVEHGGMRHSLWTGDLGVALFLRACQVLDPRFPSFQYL
jgi:hypothetical protein